MRVDAHHHLWRYTQHEFDWIDDSMAGLRQDFLPADLHSVAAGAGIQATVAVQARQTVEETRWLLETAAASPLIRGVVGWLPLAQSDFSTHLEAFAAEPLLKGLRHVVQGEADGFLDDKSFNEGIAALRGTGFVYDLLILERQLREAIRFVDRHPEQAFVVDHFAKPQVKSGSFNSWAVGLRELARRENVTCKISGLVTEADWVSWTPEILFPYWETALEAFTPARLIFGSDWPVLTVASSYGRWFDLVTEWLEPLSDTERENVQGDVAQRVYQLTPAEKEK